MSIQAIDALLAANNITQSTQSQAPTGTQFGEWFSQQLAELNEQLNTADLEVQKLAAGEETNLHQVMMALEKAKLSFQLVVNTRNAVLEAYQEVMRMQV